MPNDTRRTYVSNLPVGPTTVRLEEASSVTPVDIDKLSDGLVTGSNLIQFAGGTKAEIKSSVTLCLLAAQRVATADAAVATPQQWMDRHNMVLMNLGWQIAGGGHVTSQFNSNNVAVNEAIIPFLTAAFGGAVAGGALILTALKQLKEMAKDSPWITLFDRESRHFDVTEYQFSVAQVIGTQVILKLASARFNASFGRTQVLFFKVTRETATFESASANATTDSDLLAELNDGLKIKLAAFTKSYIQSLAIPG